MPTYVMRNVNSGTIYHWPNDRMLKAFPNLELVEVIEDEKPKAEESEPDESEPARKRKPRKKKSDE
jgi:hypothetical protein